MAPIPRQRPIAVRYRSVRRRRGVPPYLIAAMIGALLLVSWSRVSAGRSTTRPPASLPTPTPAGDVLSAPVAGAAPAVQRPALQTTATATVHAIVGAVQDHGAPAPTATATPVPTPTPFYASTWLQVHPPAHPPAVSARAAVVIDYDTHQLLYASNAHARFPQASTTKITLADVALDTAAPDLAITVSKEATEVEPDHMGVQVGEVLTLEELLFGALLDSGNDAGWAIAQGIGSLAHTVAMMNQKAAALHLTDTHYVNPVGFDDPQHYTSAYDLAVVTADALNRHPLLRQIVGTKKKIIESTKTHGWFGPTNLNSLLWSYPGAWGVKPGWTENARYCLVAAATRDGHTVLVTLLGSNDHYADGTALLNYGFARIAEGEH